MLILLVAGGAALAVYQFGMAASDSALGLVDTTTGVAKAYGAVTSTKAALPYVASLTHCLKQAWLVYLSMVPEELGAIADMVSEEVVGRVGGPVVDGWWGRWRGWE